MIIDRPIVQDLGLMGRLMVEVIPVQDFRVIRAYMAIKAIRAVREVIINRGTNSSSSRVTRAT